MKRGSEEERLRYEVYRELKELAFEMNYTVNAVVVEGPHDEKTLKLLGYKRPIIQGSKISDNDLAELTARKFSKVAVLTDFDEE